ncbi:MAG: tetratricopeptide repeat protein [Acidobacteriota bacterium]|nr:tetratricopeptide repeat protein [Acidobacteriota bacterium]
MRRTGMTGWIGRAMLVAVLGLTPAVAVRAGVRPAQGGGDAAALIAARAHFEAGQYEQARVVLTAAVAAQPDDATLYHWLSRTYLALGDDDRAIDFAKQAVERAPQRAEFHRWLGRAYGDKADRTRSFWLARKVKGEFEKAVELDPRDVAARRDLMEFYLDAPWIVGGGQDKARDQLSAIAALDPVQGDLARATYLLSDGRTDQAAEAYRRALAAQPASADPYFEAAAFYLRHRDRAALADAVAGAARVAPDDARLGFYRGVTAVIDGRADHAAERALLAYLAAPPPGDDAPSPASAHLWLGRLYEQDGRVPEAVEQYRRVLALVPDQRAARAALDRLQSAR